MLSHLFGLEIEILQRLCAEMFLGWAAGYLIILARHSDILKCRSHCVWPPLDTARITVSRSFEPLC